MRPFAELCWLAVAAGRKREIGVQTLSIVLLADSAAAGNHRRARGRLRPLHCGSPPTLLALALFCGFRLFAPLRSRCHRAADSQHPRLSPSSSLLLLSTTVGNFFLQLVDLLLPEEIRGEGGGERGREMGKRLWEHDETDEDLRELYFNASRVSRPFCC